MVARWPGLVAAGVLAAANACAMDITVRGARIIASGAIELTDEPRMAIALAQPGVRELVLHNVEGSNYATALVLAAQVQARRLNTYAAGACAAACVPVLLAGASRQFAEGEHPRRSLLALALPAASQAALRERVEAALRSRLAAGAAGQALLAAVQAAPAGATVRLREPVRNSPPDAQAALCEAPPTRDCEPLQALAGADAGSLGLVTLAGLAQVLPADLLNLPTLFGQPVAPATPDFAARLMAQGERMCAGDATCLERFRAAVPRLQAQKPFRAAALGRQRKGFGFSDNQESPDLAAKRAVYLCNHTPGNEKLCTLASIDGVDLADWTARAEAQSESARAAIKPPAVAAWAGEDEGPASAAAELRATPAAGPTPLGVAGLERWRTGALAQGVLAGTVQVLDVSPPGPERIPGALHFWEGGVAFADAAADAAFDKRLRTLLAVAAPDTRKPLAFYCAGPDCWLAVNAALRAARAGYVAGWYRGGLASWKAAGLPVAPQVPAAVLH